MWWSQHLRQQSASAYKRIDIFWSLWTISSNDKRPMPSPTQRHQQCWKPWFPTSSAALDNHESYTVTSIVTLSLAWCRRCCNTWGVCKTGTTPLHLQFDSMVKWYIKTVEKHLWKVIASHQRDWDMRLHIFLLTYRASTHNTMGFTPANLVFGREFLMPCDLLFSFSPPVRSSLPSTMQHLMDCLHDVYIYACQYLKLASAWMKTHYNHLTNSAGYEEGDWEYHTNCTNRKSPKMQPSWEAHTG
jgi:hypothetical protein